MKNMKTKTMQLSRLAVGLLLLALNLPTKVYSQNTCPCAWYQAAPPNPGWGFPRSLGEMLPFLLYDTEEAEALFLVPLEGLNTLLPTGVQALAANAEASPFRYLGPAVSPFGILAVTFMEDSLNQYGGPINRVFTSIMVQDPSWGEGVGAWYAVHSVTTSEAWQWFSMAAWGLPNTVGDTHFQSVDPKGIKAFASADGELIMRLEFSTEDMAPAPFPRIIALHTKEGYLVRAPMFATAGTRAMSWSIGQCNVKLGEHPIAQQLRSIGLGMYPSIGQTWTKHMQSTLEAGTCQPLP